MSEDNRHNKEMANGGIVYMGFKRIQKHIYKDIEVMDNQKFSKEL